jgi:hypothetical protein
MEVQMMAKLNQPFDLTIPKSSWVLVKGATGHLATHIIHELFVLGYKVRKSARNT